MSAPCHGVSEPSRAPALGTGRHFMFTAAGLSLGRRTRTPTGALRTRMSTGIHDRFATVRGVVLLLRGASGHDVVAAVNRKGEPLRRALHSALRLVPFNDCSELVNGAIHTVRNARLEGAVRAVFALRFFQASVRNATIVTVTLPRSALVGFTAPKIADFSANLMALGGLAIGLGMPESSWS